MEKNKPRMMTDKKPQEPKVSPGMTPKELSHEKLTAPAPTMDDFLKKKPVSNAKPPKKVNNVTS